MSLGTSGGEDASRSRGARGSSVHTLLSLNCQWPGYSSTQRTATPWHTRVDDFARLAKQHGATILTAQELGRVEAADLADLLGQAWSYQRSELNTVLWDSRRWQFIQTRAWVLPGYGSAVRTLLLVNLEHIKTKRRIWAGATHLQSTGGGELTPEAAHTYRAKQCRKIVSLLRSYARVIIGADLNSRDGSRAADDARLLLRAGGFRTDTDQVEVVGLTMDTKKGIDAVLSKSKIDLVEVRVLPFGEASDHDGRLAQFVVA